VLDDFDVQGGGCTCTSAQTNEANATPILVGIGLVLTAFKRRRSDVRRH
jgi:hypothetical protein